MKRKSIFILMMLFIGLMCGNGFAQINTNCGFEDWTGINPTGWHGVRTNAADANYALSDDAYEGNNALQLINDTSAHKRFSTTSINVENGKKYAVSFFAKGKGDIRLGLYDNRSTSSGYAPYRPYFNVDNSDFIQYFDTIECTNNCQNGEFILSFRNTNANYNHLIIDNVYISEVTDASFVSAPNITVAGEKYSSTSYIGSVTVTLSCSTADADIYYTLDGSDPTSNSNLYSAPFEISEDATLKAVAIKNGNSSEIISSDFEIVDIPHLFFEGFENNNIGEMIVYTPTGNVNWAPAINSGNYYAYANGHNKGDGESWLITPEITPQSNAGVVLSFKTAKNYTGYPIMVKYSTNYNGSGDPINATWTDITDEFSYSNGLWNWVNSGEYEVAGSAPIRFAWIYLCSTGNAAAWEVDNILVTSSTNVVNPELTITAPVNGSQFSTLDTLPVGFEINNFTVGTDGFLKIESPFLNLLGFGNISPLYIEDEEDLLLLDMMQITPIPEGTFTVTVSLVDENKAPLNPEVTATTTFTVTAPQLSAPIFTPASGTYADSVTFALSHELADVEIRYTTDGSTPDQTSNIYSSPITLHQTTTVKAAAFKTLYSASEVVTADYTVVFEPVLSADVTSLSFNSEDLTKNFVVSGAHLTSPIALSCNNSHFAISPESISEPNNNTQITVTFDGEESAEGTISITSGELLATVALSATAKLPAPVILPETATSDSTISITMSCANTGASIYYTLDGNEPTSNSNLYSAPVVLSEIGNYTVKAISIMENWENSDITTGTYQIVAPSVDDTLIYATGFEASEGYEATTTYNNQTIVYFGNESQQWGTYYGTVSTNSKISGAQSMQMRWYTSATQNLGYAFMNFDLQNVTHVSFKAANSNGLKVRVSHSTDGGNTYSAGEVFDVTSVAQSFDYVVDENGSFDFVRLKFAIEMPETTPTATSRLVIDEVNVYGILGLEPSTVAAPTITPSSSFYYEPQTVTISCNTESATIRYTLDGTEPTETSTVYTEPFTVNTTTTIKAKAWKDGLNASAVATSTISFPAEVANIAAFKANTTTDVQQITGDVTFVFRSGSYMFVEDNSGALLIYDNTPKITTEYNEGDVISGGIFGVNQLYNGMIELVPSHNSLAASGTASVTPAIASINDIKSEYASVYESKLVRINNVTFINSTYFVQGNDTMYIYDRFNSLENEMEEGDVADIIGFVAYTNNYGYAIYPRNDNDIIINQNIEKVANPEFNFTLSGEFYFMNITCETEDADIYYTIDGTEPDEYSYQFTSQIPLQSYTSYTIKAVAMKEGMTNSDVVTYYFTGIENHDSEISVYPNPTSDFVLIKGNEIQKVEIYNAVGQLVKVETIGDNNAKISISNLSNGNYTLRIFAKNGISSAKIVKK